MATAARQILEDGDLLAQFGRIEYAYQPIISTASLSVHAFEALARTDRTRFSDMIALLDDAHLNHVLIQGELIALNKAIEKYATFSGAGIARLFCNLDSRLYESPDHLPAIVESLISQNHLPPGSLCLEISERYQINAPENLIELLEILSNRGVKIALDDFGVGMSGLHLLMVAEPDYVKIDRCFIDDLSASTRKQAIVAKLCGLAHALGFYTVAEGVESENDFRMARDLGCDFAQGFHIAPPTVNLGQLTMHYGHTLTTTVSTQMAPQVAARLTAIEPVRLGEPLLKVADLLKAQPELQLVPVIGPDLKVAGAILEEDVRRYQLSDFGPSLLANKSAMPTLDSLVKRCPVGEANATVDAIINSYVATDSACGMILVNEGRYAGYLTNNSLVRLAMEREVSAARESNPLTQLPGNHRINQEIEQLLGWSGPATIAFFDFDHFKAFNDMYGFGAGDRALMLFADLLRDFERRNGGFVAHVGGDDFFLSIRIEEETAEDLVRELTTKFALDISSLYSASDRARGGILSLDRFGEERFFPLLRVSACILHLPAAGAHLTAEMLESQLAVGKRNAKKAASGISINRLPENGVEAFREQIVQSLGL